MPDSFEELKNSDTPLLVDFSAEWCGPCKMLAPVLKEAAAKLSGKARVIKIDVDRNPQVSTQYNIQGVPTLILFRKGQILWRQSGFMPLETLVREVSSRL